MAMRITASTSERFSDWVGARRGVLAEAVRAGVEAATMGAQLEMRQQVHASSVKPKVANMIGAAVYPKQGGSLSAAGVIFARGESADQILANLSAETVITPQRGRFLAIPTGFNAHNGWRGRSVRVTAREMLASKQAFVLPIDGGGLLWCLKVNQAQTRNPETQRVKNRAYAGGIAEVGSGRRARVNKILDRGFVPMFLLLPNVKSAGVIDAAATVERWAGRVPNLIARALPED